MTDPTCPRTFVLRDLPLAARLTLAVFLISVGIGYLSALVQLKFKHAQKGSAMPTAEDAVRKFHGPTERPMCRLEQVILADEQLPFAKGGEMSRAFTVKATNWRTAIKNRSKQLAKGRANADPEGLEPEAEAAIRKEREGERDAVAAWIRSGAREEEYTQDYFVLPADFTDRPITDFYLVKDGDKPVVPRAVKVATILNERCARCHTPDADPKAGAIPLDSYEHLQPHLVLQTTSAMGLEDLAQTTHVHLLGFAMLYGLTGFILAFTSYPRLLRVVLCPLPLLAQVVDISLWWLARLDDPYGPEFARAIVISGGIVGGSLFLHILLSLWALFTWRGRFVLLLLAGAAGFGGYVAKEKVIDPYMAQEGKPAKVAK
jgi:hypothetical protein